MPRLAGRRIARNAIIGAGLVTLAGALQGVGAGQASTDVAPPAAHVAHVGAKAPASHPLHRR